MLDIPKRELVIHRSPQAGRYSDVQHLSPSDSASPECRPGAAISIAELLPPA